MRRGSFIYGFLCVHSDRCVNHVARRLVESGNAEAAGIAERLNAEIGGCVEDPSSWLSSAFPAIAALIMLLGVSSKQGTQRKPGSPRGSTPVLLAALTLATAPTDEEA
jgi:hypothetical protein